MLISKLFSLAKCAVIFSHVWFMRSIMVILSIEHQLLASNVISCAQLIALNLKPISKVSYPINFRVK